LSAKAEQKYADCAQDRDELSHGASPRQCCATGAHRSQYCSGSARALGLESTTGYGCRNRGGCRFGMSAVV